MPRFKIVREKAAEVTADLLAIPVTKGTAGPQADPAIGRALGVDVREIFDQARFKGEAGEALLAPTYGRLPSKHVLFVGMGETGKAKAQQVVHAGGIVARRAGTARTIATSIPQAAKGDVYALTSSFIEGFLLGSYRYTRYKPSRDGDAAESAAVEEVSIIVARPVLAAKARPAIRRAEVIADATALARDLTNTPALDKSPESLADEARALAKGTSLTVKVLDEKQLEAGGYGGLIGVGRGSRKPPRLVEISYKPAGAKRHVALVGKGITFDSGGLDIKTQGMDWMKTDMAGAAAVLGAMKAVAALKPKVAVTGIICTAENMPGGNALHAGDVLRIRGGKTIEVLNTDAEGRVVMSDGIMHAKEKKADVIIDVATLTGACMIALGNKAFGVFSNRDALARNLVAAAERAGELAWHMPLFREYRKDIDSDIAEIKNIGGRYGGAITAALFLAEFAGETEWAHLDIAGPARSEGEDGEIPKGATGVGVRTLVDWIGSL